MKNILIALFILLSINSFAQSSNNNPKVFNVKLFGATGDSTQDATPFIQLAINAAVANKGGTVYFPNGFYWLSSPLVTSVTGGRNPNCQLYIPPGTYANRAHISFIGESKPNFSVAAPRFDVGYSRTGVVIKSNIQGTGYYPSVFGGVGDPGNNPFGYTFNLHYINFENLTIIVKSNVTTTGPTMSGINGSQYTSITTNNVVVAIDTSLQKDTIPQLEVAGIITTKITGEQTSNIRNTLVTGGFRYGIVAGEHCYLENAQAFGCYYGFAFLQNSLPVYATKILAHWNKYDILIPSTDSVMGIRASNCNLNISQFVSETFTTSPRWFNNVAHITDSLNRGTGQIYYSTQDDNGATIPIAQYNGTNLRTISISNTSVRPATMYLSPNHTTTSALQLKKGDGTGADVTIGVNDASFKNVGSTGNISLRNNALGGNFNVAAGGALASQMTLDSLGRFTIEASPAALTQVAGFFTPGMTNNQQSKFAIGATGASQYFYWIYNQHGSTPTSRYLALQDAGSSPGANSFTMIGGGNVGVGTLTPASKFSVVGNTLDSGNINVIGKVGIGFTATPTTPLHVKSAGGAATGMNLELTSAGNYQGFEFNSPSGLNGQIFQTGSSGSPSALFPNDGLFFINYLTNGSAKVGAGGTNGYVSFFTGGTGTTNERLKISSTGVTNLFKGAAVASAATITPTGNSFHVTGTTSITSVSGTGITAGTSLTIIFDGALTFTDGSNLKLAGNFTTSADATITLLYDGTNYYEIARSVN